MSVASPEPNNAKGLAWILCSIFAASVMSVAVRELSFTLDSRMIVLLRAGLTTALLIPALLLVPRLRRQLRFSRPGLHILRGALIGVSTHLGFYALAHLPLATASVLFFTAPIFATLLTGPIQGERVGPRRWAAVCAGFAGALIILRPTAEGWDAGMLAALGSSLLFACALLLSRRIAEADGPTAAYTSSVVLTVLITLPVMDGAWALPEGWGRWAVVAALLIGGTVRGYSDIEAYRHGEASILGPITYLRLVILGYAGYVLYGERIDAPTVAGATIIIGAALYIARREALSAQKRRRARNAAAIVPSSR